MESLYDGFDWSIGFLRDPGQWLEADKLESVLGTLEEIERGLHLHEVSGDYFTRLGHESPRLKAWGALDSVLRILPHPRELYAQPERFLGQFVSPMSPPRFFERSESRVSFRFDFPVDRFPRSARFLKAVLEALPEFIGSGRAHAPHAHVEWIGDRVLIDWSDRQVGFEATPQSGLTEPVLSPELARTILADLASSQREVEVARARVKELEQQLLQASAPSSVQTPLPKAGPGSTAASSHSEDRLRAALHEVYRFSDYFARAQQMVTLLSRPGVRAPEIETLHRRLGWEKVQHEATECTRLAVAILQGQSPTESAISSVSETDSSDSAVSPPWQAPRGAQVVLGGLELMAETRSAHPQSSRNEGVRQTSLLNPQTLPSEATFLPTFTQESRPSLETSKLKASTARQLKSTKKSQAKPEAGVRL